MADPTAKFTWDLPNVGGDNDAWGGLLNTILDEIDGYLGAMTVDHNFAGIVTDDYTPVNLGSFPGTVAVDVSAGRFFYGTVTHADSKLSISTPPDSGQVVFLMFEITDGGVASGLWPAGFDWPGGSPPTLTTSGVDVIAAYTRDGGTTWHAALAQLDSQ